ncbi:MAG TPA: arylesterase [Chthoniobacteraceae bacterium]|nr:arylesterase [Chthoniobacteraceae bacterium]
MLFAFFAVVLCTAEAAPATSSVAARPRVVILGDSITAGHGLSPSDAYPAVLQAKIDAAHLNYQVVNAGVSGDTTAGGLRRVDWALSAGAKVLVIALGGNDGLRGLSPKQTEENLNGIIQKAKAKVPGLIVIVAGMQMPASMGADFAKAYSELFPQVAKANGAALVPSLLKDVGGIEKLNQADFIHPTAEGQKKVAENVWAVLQGALAAQ